MHFITPPVETLAAALEAWTWLDLSGKRPILVTAFADVFHEADDGFWFLDTLEGTLEKVGDSRAELDELLASANGKDRFLLSGFVDRAIREGVVLKDSECFDWKLPPILGGALDYSNVEKRDFLVALHLRGQLHEQIRRLPEGAKISKFAVVDDASKPWWKFWG